MTDLFGRNDFNGKKNEPHLILIEHHGQVIADLYNAEGISREGLAYTRAFENIYEALCKRGVACSRHVVWLAICQMDRHKEHNSFQAFGYQGQKKCSLTNDQKDFLIDQYTRRSMPLDSMPYSPGGELEKWHSDFMEEFGVFMSKNEFFLTLVRMRKAGLFGKNGKRMRAKEKQ